MAWFQNKKWFFCRGTILPQARRGKGSQGKPFHRINGAIMTEFGCNRASHEEEPNMAMIKIKCQTVEMGEVANSDNSLIFEPNMEGA